MMCIAFCYKVLVHASVNDPAMLLSMVSMHLAWWDSTYARMHQEDEDVNNSVEAQCSTWEWDFFLLMALCRDIKGVFQPFKQKAN